MAELDSLSIQISASTQKAEKSINNLIGTLEKLGGAFDIKGVDGFVSSMHNLTEAINSIQTDNLKELSNIMVGLTKSTKGLATLSTNAAKSGDSVTRLGKKLADIVNIKDKNGVSMLTDALREFLQSTNGEQLSASRNKILSIAKTFGSVGSEISKDREEAQRFISELNKSKINLPMDWTKEYGDSAEGKKIRGMIGIGRTVADGSGSDADDVAKRLGIGDFQNEQDAFKAIASVASIMRDVIAEADSEVVTLGEALGTSGENAREAAESMRAFTEQLANAVGLTSQQLTDTFGGDGFLGEDYQQQNIAIEQFIQNAERLQQAGNPFQNIADGLNEIANVNLNDTTVTYLYSMKEAIASIGGKSGMNAGLAMKQIGEGLQALNVPVPDTGEQIAAFAMSLRKLGSGNVVKAAEALPFVAMGLQQLNGVQITADVAKISELAKAVSGFGYAKIEKAIANLPTLTQELTRLITALSQAPEVSRNTVELVKALGNLNVNARALEPATRRAGNALDFFSKKAKRAHSATFSLAATIGKIYATYWAVFRVVGWLGKSIDIASDLTEVQNVVDQTFGDMKYRMEDFAKTAVETVGMSELTAKQIGSRFQAMGRNMGISKEMIESTNDFVQATTKMADGSEKAYADVAHSMADVSINLTRLAGDMASFYNEEYDVVAEKLNAVFTGQTRPLRAYGLDLTQATLQEWALANGMDVNIKKMTQAEKTLLRYQYVMANTTAAHGDFIRTQDTWANTLKRASENLKRLQVILGQIAINTFKPLVANFNTAMNDIIHLAQSTLNSLGKIFGWQVEITDVGIVDDLADGLEDVEDGYEGAGKEAKRFKNFLLGIDELNLLPDNDDNDKGSGAGDALGAMANGIEDSMVKMRDTEKGYESIYDTLFKLGRRIGEVQLDWYKAIDWDKIFDKVEGAGKGLASFLNGYLADAELFYHKGRFIANGINTIAHAIYGFFHEFDGYQFGKDLGFEINGFTRNLDWDLIKGAAYEMAHDVTEFINGVIENVNWKDVGRTIAEMLNTIQKIISTFWNEIHWDKLGISVGDVINSFFLNWDNEEAAKLIHGKIQAVLDFVNNLLSTADFVMIGQKIGKFLSELHLEEFADDIAVLLWNVIKAAFELLPTMFEEAPVETALILAFAGARFTGFGNSFGSMLAGTMASGLKGAGLSGSLGTVMAMDLDAIVTSGSLLIQATAIGEAIAGGIIAAFAGYHVGLKIHDLIFEDDAMWSEPGAVVEAVKNFWWWDDAIGQMVTDLQTNVAEYDKALDSFYGINEDFAKKDFGIKEGMTWEDVKHSISTGSMQYSEAQFEQMKEMLVNSGNSNIDVNNLINDLKTARDNYVNGFAPWLEEQSDIQYALKNGAQYADQILDDAYDRYNSAMEKEAELARKREELYNSPENQRQRYNARQEMLAEVEAWNSLSEAQKNWARITGQVPDSILDFKQVETIEVAKKSIDKCANALGGFGKKSAEALSSLDRTFNEVTHTNSEMSNTMMSTLEQMDSRGSGLFTGEARNIENLNTKLLTTQSGIERIITAMDEIGNRKDKTNNIKDSFDGIKGKVDEVSSLFTIENMDNMFSAIPKAFRYAWQDAINIMKTIWAEMANWINKNAQLEIPKVKVGNQEYGGHKVRVEVPRFDVGGSIPNNGSLFFANEKGPEVMANMGSSTGIMNTDQMEAAIANGMMRALANGGQNVTVVLQGDASSFFTAMVKENNNSIMRTGSSPLRH